MQVKHTQVLQWARRVRDFLVEYDLKSAVAELRLVRQELADALDKLTANAAAQEAITKQARVQTTEIRRIRATLRDGLLKPIIRMSRTMELEINGAQITFTLPPFRVDSERLAAAADAMVTALKVVGPQFVARGFAADFVEQVSTATKALRDAIDQRAAQVARRTGTTAAVERDGARVTQLVRVIDTLVRPVIASNPELLATWENVVAVRQSPRSGGVVASTPAESTSPAMTLTVERHAAA
jgi:hypothetical protein